LLSLSDQHLLLLEQAGAGCGIIKLLGRLDSLGIRLPAMLFKLRTSSIDYASTDFISNEIRAEERRFQDISPAQSYSNPDSRCTCTAFWNGLMSSIP
jgi:hypothetical protein